MAVPYQIKTD